MLKKTKRKIATIFVALLMMTTAAVAESSLPECAAALIPPTAVLVETDRDDGVTEYELRDGDMRYELLVRNNTVLALVTENKAVKPGKENLLTAEEAAASLTGELLHAHAEKDDGRWTWKLILRDGADLVEYDLHAETGEIIETERYIDADLALPEGNPARLDLEWDDGVLQWDAD